MRAKPSTSASSGKPSRTNGKSQGGNHKRIVKRNKETDKKIVPDLSVLRQPVDTSVNGLKQAVKLFETGTPEILQLLTYDCDVVYECKVCRNLFRSIANFISHKRVYCTQRYSQTQDLHRSAKEGDNYTVILGEKAPERLPTRITARKDLTSIVETLAGQTSGLSPESNGSSDRGESGGACKDTTVHLEPIDNTAYGVFQTVLKPDSQTLMKNQVEELQNLLAQNEAVLGPDGRILQNGLSDLNQDPVDDNSNDKSDLICSICNSKFSSRKSMMRHKRLIHESVKTTYSCPCCKNYFCNPWSVYRHLYKVHRKTNEQVRRLRAQIHKKNIKVDKTPVNRETNKRVSPSNKKKTEIEQHSKIIQDNKEWMDHFEDDWELQRCGGCGRKFERKAALMSHSQICQKRIAAYNRMEQSRVAVMMNKENSVVPVVAISSLPCTKKPIPKPSPEKKIGIQVRMNYCKSGNSSSPSRALCRQRSNSRSVLGDGSDIDSSSVDGRDGWPTRQSESSALEQFLKNPYKCQNLQAVDNVPHVNNTVNRENRVHTYEISTCKRSTVLRSNISKSKSLEAKCLQLRSAVENGSGESFEDVNKEKGQESSLYFDGNFDNTSESSTSALSSLSSQLTPLVEKGYVCEQSIEIKNINISRSLENTPGTEADSTSNGGGLHMVYNTRTYKENIRFSPPKNDLICEEVSTSVVSDERMPFMDRNAHLDSCLNDDEISLDLKPLNLHGDELMRENDYGNTISILTRNQIKAICKDDFMPVNGEKKIAPLSLSQSKKSDANVNAQTKEIVKKRFKKYMNEDKVQCNLCKRRFRELRALYSHIPTHTHWKRYQCLFSGCTLQYFSRGSCAKHVMLAHTKTSNVQSSHSFVGLISPNKWKIRISFDQKKVLKSQSVKGKPSLSTKSAIRLKKQKENKLSHKLSQKVSNPSFGGKVKPSSKAINAIDKNKRKESKMLVKVGTKQKLLTDFKNFSQSSKFNPKSVSQVRKSGLQKLKNINTKLMNKDAYKKQVKVRLLDKEPSNQKKTSVLRVKRLKKNEPYTKDKSLVKNHKRLLLNADDKNKGKAVLKTEVSQKEKEKITNKDDFKIDKESPTKKDLRKEEIIVNHIVIENSGSPPGTPNSVNIQTSEMMDSSQEEEESQESDKPVDDSHLKKIFMEVIFGPSAAQTQASQRPVRNKTRPKRDNDFILGIQKDNDKETTDIKVNTNKKASKSTLDSKASAESSRKSK